MTNKTKRLAFVSVFVFILISVAAFAKVLYPNALVFFSGIELETADDGSTRGYVDITLKQIETTGVSFCLKYNQDYVQLSNLSDNKAIENPPSAGGGGGGGINLKELNIEHTYFEQDTDNFPMGSFKDKSPTIMMPDIRYYSLIGIADQDTNATYGYVIMNFVPEDGSDALTSNIQESDDTDDGNVRLKIMADSKEGLRLGRLSFRIKEPSAFATLTASDLEDIIKVVPFSEMDTSIQSNEGGVQISYIGEDGRLWWHSNHDQYVDYEFDINAKLSDVELVNKEMTISAYEIYKNGSIQDLADFLNEKMYLLSLEYSDGSIVPASMKWTAPTDITWDAKGGDYVVTQKYNDFDVTATVHVTPVNLTGYYYENDDISYWVDDPNYPQTYDNLNFPTKAKPILDTYVPNGGVPELGIWISNDLNTESIVEIPDGIANKEVGVYNFLGQLDDRNELNAYPWLTIPATDPPMQIVRRVVATEDELPNSLIASGIIEDDGTLKITVSFKPVGGVSPDIPNGTEFYVNMPGGDPIGVVELGNPSSSSVMTADYDTGSTTTVIITVSPTNASQKLIQMLNLGGRADGTFSIAAKEPGKGKSSYTNFDPNARKNIYTAANPYVFDFTGAEKAKFPVNASATVPVSTTLSIPQTVIDTTYNGYDGTEPGELSTFTIDNSGWTLVSGDPGTAGSEVEILGTLADTTYTNYGRVQNPNGVTVTIKYVVLDSTDEDVINDIKDFTYNPQQVGYDYNKLQNQMFAVTNKGNKTISGLTVTISLAADNNQEAYTETKQLPQILAKDESAEFGISTKIGLDVGTYVSTVSIYSNTKLLDTFTITFEVTEKPVFEIELIADPDDLGTAKTANDTYTAKAGEEITIKAEPKDDCEFDGWESDNPDVVFADASAEETTFTMPDPGPGKDKVTITAKFVESEAAKFKPVELHVRNTDDVDQQLYDADWEKVDYDPFEYEYNVAVPNDAEYVYIYFKLRDDAADAEKELTFERPVEIAPSPPSQQTDTITINTESDTEFKSDDIGVLVISADVNELTLKIQDKDDSDIYKTYTINVYRKIKNSQTITFNYGNSPYGLIMRDSAISDDDKQAVKDAFKENFTFIENSVAGVKSVPDGAVAGVKYRDEAWTSEAANNDLNEMAVFVTDLSSFYDSGYSDIQNSIGGAVDASTITRKVKVRVIKTVTPADMNGSSADFSMIDSEYNTIDVSSSGAITELSDKRIRPDNYEIIYSFTDFDGSTATVSKPLIVLSPLGDVNISGAADAEDVSRILKRSRVNIANHNNVSDYDVGGRLHKYRICDVNKDGSLNAVDANFVRANNKIIPFYTNLTGGGG